MSAVTIQHADFDVAKEYAALRDACPQAGAMVVFVGLVREFSTPRPAAQGDDADINGLYLEHYEGMTEPLIEQTIGEAAQRFDILQARVVHRVGPLSARDQIVLVGVAGHHRLATFSAAEYIMDTLKSTATIWKKECTDGGDHWLGLKASDAQAAARWHLDPS